MITQHLIFKVSPFNIEVFGKMRLFSNFVESERCIRNRLGSHAAKS